MTIDKLLHYFRLGSNAEDPKVAMESIERAVVFRGTNLMILVFAILIASVGLNVNSAAVVIGAMLISPLMGPIVGIGAGLGVLDLKLVRRALKNLGFAVGASLLTSYLYFLLSPLEDAASEILARTSPGIWDVLIALSGGFAGIIATASKDRGNVVPGVAIATALMPPLCTAGYGLAHAEWSFFFGAMYLFLINSVFISIAAFATVNWLGYPTVQWESPSMKRKIKNYTTIIVIATAVPSVFLAWRLVQQNTFAKNAGRFVKEETAVPNNFLVDHSIDPSKRSIRLVYMGNGVDTVAENEMQRRLDSYGIKECELQITTGLSLRELGNEERNANEGLQQKLDEQRAVLARLASLNDSLSADKWQRGRIMAEARAVDPNLQWLVITDMPQEATGSDSLQRVVTAHYSTSPDTSKLASLDRWLRIKLNGQRYKLAVTSE